MTIGRREFLLTAGIVAGGTVAPPGLASSRSDRCRVRGLKVNYLDRPRGLDSPNPRFSWQLESEWRNIRQSAYRILVSSSEVALKAGRGELWDSGYQSF